MLIWLLACAEGTSPVDSGSQVSTQIESVAVDCDREQDLYLLDLRIQGWTAGATLWVLAPETGRVEAHSLRSQRADPDGAWEELALELESVADPRDQQDGESTVFVCGELEDLAFRLGVESSRGDSEADCRVWGQPTSWADLLDMPDCASLE